MAVVVERGIKHGATPKIAGITARWMKCNNSDGRNVGARQARVGAKGDVRKLRWLGVVVKAAGD